MQYLKTINRKLSGYIDVAFLFRFIILAVGLYYFNLLFIGITDPKGRLYISFLANYLDYIAWLRSSILHTSKLITRAFGFNTYVADIYTLKVSHGWGLKIGLTCIGYGLMSFWIAFIVAQNTPWKKKLIWCLSGLVAIWFINCVRVALLFIALQNKWAVNRYIDHHDLFNLFAYLLIILMMYVYHKSTNKKPAATNRIPGRSYYKDEFVLTTDIGKKVK